MRFDHAHRMTFADMLLRRIPDQALSIGVLVAIGYFTADVVGYSIGVIIGGLTVYLFMAPKEIE